ncbi:MAG: DUF2865 domain-containing protein [Bradyrhizobium sp.]|uniref:DUF2865 domain-containing protein n=1 Tax=Bradyrhizobium sp. TaxID=376 RepID=UPI002731AEF5|nr:DUF2865 domain-containing protein [Bradyrhizobium sp.]MDP1867801.1 DUF2865 domain-containing protein [Bradyrhizobium sp.]
MNNFYKRSTRIIAAMCVLLTCAAQAENAYDIMSGGAPSRSGSTMVMAYGEDPKADFPPRALSTTRSSSPTEASTSYCVRTCDGRYFPAPSGTNRGSAEGCKSFCPASETRVFFGSSIDSATSNDGRTYAALPNAFRYRKELVAGCTCNGKDVVGLASINVKEDRTLRRGDIVAGAAGLEVVTRIGNGHVGFARASAATRGKYDRLKVLASD